MYKCLQKYRILLGEWTEFQYEHMALSSTKGLTASNIWCLLKSDEFVEKHADSGDSELSGTTWKQWYWYILIHDEELL